MTDSNYCADIKTVVIGPTELRLGDTFDNEGPQTTLSFDILGPQPAHLRYRIRHCNAQWMPDQLDAVEFINGLAEGIIDNYKASFNTRTDYIHYEQVVPGRYNRLTASGNYIVEVFPDDRPDSILLVRRFRVYEEMVDIAVTMGKPSAAYGSFGRDQQVDVTVSPRNGSNLTMQESHYIVELQQNRREDLRRRLDFNGYSGNAMRYEWGTRNVFAGGNHFRYFDLSNLWARMYHVQRIEQWGGEIFAFLQPDEERSRKVYTQYNSLNGGMKVNVRDHPDPDTEADYVWVNFSLPMQRPFLDGSVHIAGELTQWHLDDASRMEWNAEYKAYTKRMLLKQGYYSYQLLFLPTGEREALTSPIEGDHYEMTNNYTVRVYYRAPGSRYDRLVGTVSEVFH